MPLAYTWGIQVEDTNLGRVAQAMTGGIVGALAMLATTRTPLRLTSLALVIVCPEVA